MELRLLYLKVAFLPAVCRVCFCNGQKDMCRILEFAEPINGRALRGHIFRKLSVDIQDNCRLKCYLESDCFSYNLGPLVNNKYICELSDSDHRKHPGDLLPTQGFLYGATKRNPCSLSPCSPNRKCQNGFTDQGYRCKCRTGFTGHACQKLIWTKINTAPVCFGTRGDSFGSFTILEAGNLGALKLVHISGTLVCHDTSTRSFWGCEVPSYNDKTLMTIISYPQDRIPLLPRREFTQMGVPGRVCASDLTYRLDGFDDISPEIIFNTTSVPLVVSLGQEFRIWYGQDMADCSETNNSGESCVDVYGWYI